MVVAMSAVHMAVGNLFGAGGTHFGHFVAKLQRLPSQGVVAVQMHHGAFDFHQTKCLHAAIGTGATDHAARLHAGRKIPKVRDLKGLKMTLAQRLDTWKASQYYLCA